MTKAELTALLQNVSDDARITLIRQDGTVMDIAESNYGKAKDGWLNQDEVYLRE